MDKLEGSDAVVEVLTTLQDFQNRHGKFQEGGNYYNRMEYYYKLFSFIVKLVFYL
jgi:hypothetical protein